MCELLCGENPFWKNVSPRTPLPKTFLNIYKKQGEIYFSTARLFCLKFYIQNVFVPVVSSWERSKGGGSGLKDSCVLSQYPRLSGYWIEKFTLVKIQYEESFWVSRDLFLKRSFENKTQTIYSTNHNLKTLSCWKE